MNRTARFDFVKESLAIFARTKVLLTTEVTSYKIRDQDFPSLRRCEEDGSGHSLVQCKTSFEKDSMLFLLDAVLKKGRLGFLKSRHFACRRVFVVAFFLSGTTSWSSPKFLSRKLNGSFVMPAAALASTSPSSLPSATTVVTSTEVDIDKNPLLSDWSSQPFHFAPFDAIEPSHFPSALTEGMRRHMDDLHELVDNSDAPTFENTIAAYDRAGSLLRKVSAVFSNLCSSCNTPELQAVQKEMTPLLSRHRSACYQLPGLFDRIQTVYEQTLVNLEDDSCQAEGDSASLTPEQLRLVERVHMDFTRAGAALSQQAQAELADLQAELASLSTQFQQNVMKDEEEWEMALTREEMSGCPESLLEAAEMAAKERSGEGPEKSDYVITLSRSLVEPFLTFADRRDLRKRAWEAWVSRGELNPERDNLTLAIKILKLRKRVAEIHGYSSFAAYQCADRMAKTPERVQELLENVWSRAKESANRELEVMEEFVRESGEELQDGIQPYDWRYYAEKVRKAKYDFDESLLKPYLSLEKIREALFAVSSNLFGLKYVERLDIKTYHPDVDTYEVRDGESNNLVSLFIHDNFARPFKTSGAWMSEYRTQTRNLGSSADPIEGIPIVSNNNNFAKSKDTLLSYDDAHTLFHEFGHAHHGMLSNASYRRLASTNVLTDFVELPSQLMEHWFDQREVLKKYARHYQTGEPVPDELLDKLQAARSFQQGFQTVEYTICALLDMSLHQVEDVDNLDLATFEKEELERLGMPRGIVMRHRPAHFQHLFSTSMYAAGYYVYLWAEVLDADAFAAFEETGDIFDRDTAAKARKFIYGAGNTEAPDELFRKFRGRDPQIEFMLKKKGLISE